MSLYPNPFLGPGECRGGNGYCATHDQPVLACENERLLAENVLAIKRAEQAEADLARVRAALVWARDADAAGDDAIFERGYAMAIAHVRAALEGR